ncbi:hypothetical protein LTR95_001019 [Oleoguttula sp. CCFEE 5521]
MYRQEIELPADEEYFMALTHATQLRIPRPESRGSIRAQMTCLSRIWTEIQELNRSSVENLLAPMSAAPAIAKVARKLQDWYEGLPAGVQKSTDNVRCMAAAGHGALFCALHLGYHYYHEVLFYQFMAESHHNRSPVASSYAVECAQHARAFCDLLYLAERPPDCKCLYAMVGHMLVVTSTVYVHILLFNGDSEEHHSVRSRLEHNFEILTQLQGYWPTKQTSLARLKVFHNACLYSIEHSFRMDWWMLRFILVHGSTVPEKFSMVELGISASKQLPDRTHGSSERRLPWYSTGIHAHQRVAAACDECRTKKVKRDSRRPDRSAVCRGVRRADSRGPVCSPCARKRGPSANCSWGVRKRRGRTTSRTGVSPQGYEAVEGLGTSQVPAGIEHENAFNPQPPHVSGAAASYTNVMMGFMNEEHQGSPNTFGDSSATGFMHQIKKAIDRQITRPGLQSPVQVAERNDHSLTWSKPSQSLQKQLDYVLPPRHRADYLLGTYWRLVDTLYPLLDRTEVESQYRRLWTGEAVGGDEAAVFVSLLNIIFSTACALDATIPPDKRVSSANIFFHRAQELLDLGFVRIQSVMTVQCFLLFGQYLQSTNDPQQCWNFVALAIRMAQSLGLDLPSTSA